MHRPPVHSHTLGSFQRLITSLLVAFSVAFVNSAQAQVTGSAETEVQAKLQVEVPREQIERAKQNAMEALFRPIALGIDGYLGAGLGVAADLPGATFAAGVGLQVGFPIGLHLEPFLRGDVMARSIDGGWVNTAGASTGVRFRLNPWAPLYVDSAVGYGWSDAPFVAGAFADFGGGLRFSTCGLDSAPGAFTIGTKVRVGLQDNDHVTGWFGTLGYSWGGPVASRFECPPEPPPSQRLPGRAVVIRERKVPDAPQEPWVYEPPTPDAEIETEGGIRIGAPTPSEPKPVEWPEEQRYSEPWHMPVHEEPSAPIVFPWAIGFEMAAGPTQTPASSYGYGGLVGVRAEFGETFGVSTRYGWLSVDPATGTEQGSTTHGLFVGPQYRLFTDYDDFAAWRFALEGGYGFGRHAMPDGFILSADVTREVGLRVGGRGGHAGDSNGALVFELGARLQQGLGDLSDYRSAQLLTGFKLGFMLDSGPTEDVTPTPHTFGAQMAVGSTWGMRLHAGYLVTDWLAPEARFDLAANGLSLDEDATLGLSAGAKLYLDRWLPVAIEAGAGYAIGYGPQADALTGPVADAGVYGWFSLCEAPVDFYAGVRGQLALDSDDELDRLMFAVGVEYSGRNRKDTLLCRPPTIETRVLDRPIGRPQTQILPSRPRTGAQGEVRAQAEVEVQREVEIKSDNAAQAGVDAQADVTADASIEVESESEPIDWPLSFHFGIGGGLSLEGDPAPLRPGLGVGLGVGVPIGNYVEPRLKGSYRYIVEPSDALAPSTNNFDVGLDVRTLLGPLYLQAGAGHVWQSGEGAPDKTGYFLDAGIGARFVDCTRSGDGYGINVGLEGRLGLGEDDVGSALFITAGYEWGTPTADLECMPSVEVPKANAEGRYELEAEAHIETE